MEKMGKCQNKKVPELESVRVGQRQSQKLSEVASDIYT